MGTDVYQSGRASKVGYVTSSGDIYQSGRASKVGYAAFDGIGERSNIRQIGGAALLLLLME